MTSDPFRNLGKQLVADCERHINSMTDLDELRGLIGMVLKQMGGSVGIGDKLCKGDPVAFLLTVGAARILTQIFRLEDEADAQRN